MEVPETNQRWIQRTEKAIEVCIAYGSSDHRLVEPDIYSVDCRLGDSWKEVYQNAGQPSGSYVLAHHKMILPVPDLMELLPEDIRQEVVREVTERIIDTWHIEQ